MRVYRDEILPRVIDKVCGSADIGTWRARCLEGMAGTIVEPGFGSGHNLAHYPDAVTRVYAVDPATRGRTLAADRLAASSIEVEFVGLDGQDLPLDDDSCDGAALTFTLCTIPDPLVALAELRRVLRPGAAIHLLEHGLAETDSMQRWQRRIDPVQKRLFDGCHLSRDHGDLLERAGFEVESMEHAFVGGTSPWSFLHLGRAVVAS